MQPLLSAPIFQKQPHWKNLSFVQIPNFAPPENIFIKTTKMQMVKLVKFSNLL